MKRQPLTEVHEAPSPESLVARLRDEPGVVLLRSSLSGSAYARYSLVAARPFLTFQSRGARCETRVPGSTASAQVQFGDPWRVLDQWMGRYQLPDELDLPFPLGGCFGYWGYELKNFVEPKLPRRAFRELDVPDCFVGFYDSLVVFDHWLGKAWIISTGLDYLGARTAERAAAQVEFWRSCFKELPAADREPAQGNNCERALGPEALSACEEGPWLAHGAEFGSQGEGACSNLSRGAFEARVKRAQGYIRAGDIYQVNLSHRLRAPLAGTGWEFFQRLNAVSPSPFAAYLDAGSFQLASSSPELFLRLSGAQVQTRPIKGTRPRARDGLRDAQLAFELQTSAKEMAELVMITDLLRNDLGKVCEFGSVAVPDLVRLERYAQVQHLVSTVEGRLRTEVTHLEALAACFPGGSITGAPKFRAMEIIDELEPITRGPYTGALGYLGFNRESQLSILIRAALCSGGNVWFHVGAGIVADSIPEAEWDETLAKAGGFFQALGLETNTTRLSGSTRAGLG